MEAMSDHEETEPLNMSESKMSKMSSLATTSQDSDEDTPQKTPTCADKWEGEKFVWDREEFRRTNKKLSIENEIKEVARFPDSDDPPEFGFRAHPSMDWQKCFRSVVVPWH